MRPTTNTLEPTRPSDSQLIADAGAGNVDAFVKLYDRYCDRAYRLALAICRDDDHAQDAVQEAFVSIWRSSASYRTPRGTVSAWLLSVVRHRAIDLTRRDGPISARHASDSCLDSRPDECDLTEQTLAREQASQLKRLLDELPDPQREVITLAFYGQLSHVEIAKHLGLANGTVKGRMRLGLRKLHAGLEPPTR